MNMQNVTINLYMTSYNKSEGIKQKQNYYPHTGYGTMVTSYCLLDKPLIDILKDEAKVYFRKLSKQPRKNDDDGLRIVCKTPDHEEIEDLWYSDWTAGRRRADPRIR